METKKEFDCVEMKREAQTRIYEETKDMTPDQEIAYWREKSEAFRRELETAKAAAARKAS